ncbi:MAG TPA: hypothetical protein DCE33_14055 [Rhodospirillaceae bacterium]|nr:hypothetical protein [Rhodospirillaceae bacterium]
MFRSSLVLGSFLTSSACLAGPTQPSQANISVTVPEICSIDARSLLIDKEKGVISGEVLEMCNSNRAFRLIASHRMLQPGEQGRIDYAGESSNLEAEGISDVAVRQGPVIRRFPIFVRTAGLQQDLTISLGFAAI